MRVLHMPVNTASIAYTTVHELRRQSIDAQAIVFESNVVQSFDGLWAIKLGNKHQPFQALKGIVEFGFAVWEYVRIAKPDVIHWYYSGSAATLNIDLQLLRALGVPGLVEWAGADIRIPEIEFAENPYYTAVFNQGYEYRRFESRADSRARQQRFADLGFASLAATGMLQYVQRDIFPQIHRLEQRLDLTRFVPAYPLSTQTRPLIVHSPTAPVTKGTAAVLKAIEVLRDQYEFDFQLVQGVSRQTALGMMQQADIFLDQFVLGDRGLAALEAMAYGKPVVCYLKPSLVRAYPADLPIVNATQDTLTTVLADLIVDGKRRRLLGEQGRAYVERHHAASHIIPQLIDIYQTL